MNDITIFAIAMCLNIIGTGLLIAALLVTALQSFRKRTNLYLFGYISTVLIWSISSLTTRVIMTSPLLMDTLSGESAQFTMMAIVLISICSNSPFLLGFAIEYAGSRNSIGWRIALATSLITNIGGTALFLSHPYLLISDYGITSVGMIFVDTSPTGFLVFGLAYFVWVFAAAGLLVKRAMPEAKPILLGVLLPAAALAIESTTDIGDRFPLAILCTGIAAICFVYTIVRDQQFNPLRQSNEALRRSEDNLQRIMSAIPACATVTDADGNVLWFNEQTKHVLDIEADEVLGANMWQFFSSEKSNESVLETLRAEGQLRDTEFVFKTSKGDQRWGRLNIVPLIYNGQQASLDVLEDIHEYKQAQESLQQVQKWEGLAVLAGGVAHDFNNLLVGIMGHASILEQRLKGDPASLKHVSKLMSAARRSADLTKQMLAYSGRGQFVTRAVDFNEVIRENIGLIYASTSHAVLVDTDLRDSLPTIMADPTQMQQVVMNLAINAAQAIDDKREGLITFQTDISSIHELRLEGAKWSSQVGTFKDQMYVVIEIADNGTGMDQQTLVRVFEPFFSTKSQGSGLGLAAVQGILRGHNGVMRVRSTPGQGTTFQLMLPVSGELSAEQDWSAKTEGAHPVRSIDR